jgi:hypothetical protein
MENSEVLEIKLIVNGVEVNFEKQLLKLNKGIAKGVGAGVFF